VQDDYQQLKDTVAGLESLDAVSHAYANCRVYAQEWDEEKVCSASDSPATDRPWSLEKTCCQVDKCGNKAEGCMEVPAQNFHKDDFKTVVYVLDTGIHASHEAFITPNGARRVIRQFKFDNWETPEVEFDPSNPGAFNTDGNGHGTHCTGSVGGDYIGVDTEAAFIGMKVLSDDGWGSFSDINAAVQKAADLQNSDYRGKNCIISMSLGGGTGEDINSYPGSAYDNAVQAGCIVVLAAGNDTSDVEGSDEGWAFGPAIHGHKWTKRHTNPEYQEKDSHPGAILTVGSTNSDEQLSYFSNYGWPVGIYAPGSDIKSSVPWSDDAYDHYSGTSMATPHTAGILSKCLTERSRNNSSESQIVRNRACINKILDCDSDKKINTDLGNNKPLIRAFKTGEECGSCGSNPSPTPSPDPSDPTTSPPVSEPSYEPTDEPDWDTSKPSFDPTEEPDWDSDDYPPAEPSFEPTEQPDWDDSDDFPEPGPPLYENICDIARFPKNLKKLKNICKAMKGEYLEDDAMCQDLSTANISSCCQFACEKLPWKKMCQLHEGRCKWNKQTKCTTV